MGEPVIFSIKYLIQFAEGRRALKLLVVIERESPGQGLRAESESNFLALICFHYLSKAIISLFRLHNFALYKIIARRREGKGQTLCVCSSQQCM